MLTALLYLYAWPHELCHWLASHALGEGGYIQAARFRGNPNAVVWKQLIVYLAPALVTVLLPGWALQLWWLAGCAYDFRDAARLLARHAGVLA